MSSIGIRAVLGEVEALGTQSIVVDEWKHPETKKPIEIFWKPLSPKEVSKYADTPGKKKKGNLNISSNARLIVDHAKDEDGNKLFEPADMITLSKAGYYKTVNRVALAILGEEDDEDEDSDLIDGEEQDEDQVPLE